MLPNLGSLIEASYELCPNGRNMKIAQRIRPQLIEAIMFNKNPIQISHPFPFDQPALTSMMSE